ncbi:MAG TPA: cation:proton antiporter [Solirubrobacterales bacterium]|nr:cation:proton antiporter [Solirubrobacterales bacterium]
MIGVDAASFLVIVAIAALAGLLVTIVGPRLVIPVVVVELVLGILVGPQVAGIARLDPATQFFGNLGLGMLFFFAGYEINFERIKGQPLKLAGTGWLISLVLAYAMAGVLAATGVVVSGLYTGSAIATTAIGTLIPILRDAGELRTRFGTYLLAAGAAAEFGPILLVTLVLSTGHPLHEALILVLFVALAVATGILAVRSAWRGWALIERTFEASSQLGVRLAVVLVFALVALASELGLDLLLGGFVAGMIMRLALRGRELRVFESKLTAVGYGFLIPFFFVTSGMAFNADELFTDPVALLKLPLFVAMFLIVRGVPALLLYRGVFSLRDRTALGIFCATELPLVVAITTLALDGGKMHPSTAAALVGAAIISTLVFPLLGLRLRRDRPKEPEQPANPTPEPAAAQA